MITSFKGNYDWLSNFYLSPITANDGITYPSVENAYQAQKEPLELREKYTRCSPGEAKRLGKRASLPSNWDVEKLIIMQDLIDRKFLQNESLKNKLLNTFQEELIEGNWWGDTFWGVCRVNGELKGQNHLGKILMELRFDLMKELCAKENRPVPNY